MQEDRWRETRPNGIYVESVMKGINEMGGAATDENILAKQMKNVRANKRETEEVGTTQRPP